MCVLQSSFWSVSAAGGRERGLPFQREVESRVNFHQQHQQGCLSGNRGRPGLFPRLPQDHHMQGTFLQDG